MSRLNFDYFVWLDADTVFARNPVGLLGAGKKAHAAYSAGDEFVNLDGRRDMEQGVSLHKLRDFMRSQGVANEVYWNRSAFWIAHHEVIEPLCVLAIDFWKNARDAVRGWSVSAAAGLCMMQILCAEPRGSFVGEPAMDLWASADEEVGSSPEEEGWVRREPFTGRETRVRPAIMHLTGC